MVLVQLFLPLRDNAGAPLPAAMFAAERASLVGAFGGVTAYQRAPATGLWQDGSDEPGRDELLLFEGMVETLDRGWWRARAEAIAARFGQEQAFVRALPCAWL